jgi:hypothetical protein
MRLACFVAAAVMATAVTAHAQKADSAAFLIRLGHDTTSIERYIRTADQLIVEAVQRAPSTMVHRYVLDLGPQNSVRKAVYAVSQPGKTANVFERTITFTGDSATVVTVQGSGAPATRRVLAKNAIPIAGPFYSPYELTVMRAVAGKAKATRVYLLAGDTVGIPVERIGTDSVTLTNQFGEPMRAHIDASGRLLHLHTPAFTTLERLRWVDLDALTRMFAARDSVGKGLGQLSPRQTYRSRVGNANIWVDYSRPAARGRPIWGALVPYGSVWRLGANDATHFSTDRALELGGVSLAPGTYTLFLLPTATDWTLIVNSGTGMSGLDRDEAKDVGRVKLEKQNLNAPVESLTIDVPQQPGNDSRLAISWGTTRAFAPIVVK